jgi:hypothetical protein
LALMSDLYSISCDRKDSYSSCAPRQAPGLGYALVAELCESRELDHLQSRKLQSEQRAAVDRRWGTSSTATGQGFPQNFDMFDGRYLEWDFEQRRAEVLVVVVGIPEVELSLPRLCQTLARRLERLIRLKESRFPGRQDRSTPASNDCYACGFRRAFVLSATRGRSSRWIREGFGKTVRCTARKLWVGLDFQRSYAMTG